MKRVKSLLFFSMVLLVISCSMSAKPEKGNVDDSSDGTVVVLNKADFLKKVYNYEKNQEEWVYEGDKPCIIDFYADWCGPCKKIAPVLKELAEQYRGQIVIYKVNVDNEKELASTFGIKTIPTLLFVPMKGKPQLAQGALPKDEFVKQIDSYLLNKK